METEYYVINGKRYYFIRENGVVLCSICNEGTGYNKGSYVRHLREIHKRKV